jgi:alpha-L-rhamnosidase
MRWLDLLAAIVLPLIMLVTPVASIAHEKIDRLRIEYLEAPIGIDARAPRFSWQLTGSRRDAAQSAYQLLVARSESALFDGSALLWDSGRVSSDDSTQVSYAGPTLESRSRYFWRVRVWDEHGRDLGLSPIAHFEMGMLNENDWSADWIGPGDSSDLTPLLRHEFSVQGKVRQARVYVSSHGLYELSINGRRVGDQVLTPGWTSYNHRLQYQAYDVSNFLNNGVNAIGASLGPGWFSGVVGLRGNKENYGKGVALILQMHITYDDGRSEIVGSNETWNSTTGPIRRSGIYEGESYDARLDKAGWSTANYDDAGWNPVKRIEASKAVLVASQGPAVERIEEIKAQKIFKTPAGDTVVDFGQNLVGWVHLEVQGKAGTRIRLRHAEVLDHLGNFYTDNLRTAKQLIEYTLKGGGRESFEPHFTFQGFRYVAIEGYPGALRLSDLKAVVVHSAMPRTGDFVSDKPLLNRLQHNIIWGQKGNFVDVPTDCPQRDERLGWTGDAQVFLPTAAFNMDVAAFFTKWLKDLVADQLPDGSIPFVAPDILSIPDDPQAGAAGWGDAATVIPWNLYLAYGDRRLLEAQYPSMQRWVAYVASRAGADNIWDGDTDNQFGDWLDFFSAAKNTRYGSTSTDLIATAYYARSVDILRRVAGLLGKNKDATRYAALHDAIKAAFGAKFVAADGTVGEGTQTAYVLALDFDLLPEGVTAAAAEKLANDVRQRQHLTTGFLGTPHLLRVLSRYGYVHEAYALLNREDFPSWLYPVKQGATTIWERWDGLKADGSFQDAGMNSFNHYAYGAVGEWMYQTIGGIRPDEQAPGYKHFSVSPQPGGGLKHAAARHLSPYGEIVSEWRISGEHMSLIVNIPPNSSASIILPRAARSAVEEGRRVLKVGDGIRAIAEEGDTLRVETGAGHYEFSYPFTWIAADAKFKR